MPAPSRWTRCYEIRHWQKVLLVLMTWVGLPPIAVADNDTAAQFLQHYPQYRNMGGYVLNTETNMNRIYTQKLNQELAHPQCFSSDESVIQFEDSPQQSRQTFCRPATSPVQPLLPHGL